MGEILSQPSIAQELLAANVAEMRIGLLRWFDRHRRDLPWRRTKDPYAIWVSEIMLQQTRVAAVIEKYEAFLQNFPTVAALANASEAEVLSLWSGLGYYRRARMLHRAAQVVVEEHGGALPATAAGLRALPGIGAYTSAAIASIAFGEPAAVVDGNVERVVQRIAGWGSENRTGATALSRRTEQFARQLLDPHKPGDFNQAMMELGATVCLPRNPKCLTCPLRFACQTRGEHPTPVRARMKSQDAGYALVIRSSGGYREVLLEQRGPEQTVMTGMWELPALREIQVPKEKLRLAVRHAIMQVNYSVRIMTVFEDDVVELTVASDRRQWVRLRDVATMPLTGLARKVLMRAGLDERMVQPLVSAELQ